MQNVKSGLHICVFYPHSWASFMPAELGVVYLKDWLNLKVTESQRSLLNLSVLPHTADQIRGFLTWAEDTDNQLTAMQVWDE